jgi:hypothetical protein
MYFMQVPVRLNEDSIISFTDIPLLEGERDVGHRCIKQDVAQPVKTHSKSHSIDKNIFIEYLSLQFG